MTKSGIWGIIVITLLVIGGIWAAKQPSSTVPDGEVIKIGSILILSGEGATWGEATRNGIELAVKEVNARGGIDGKMLEVIYEDDQSQPQRAISAFHKLTDIDGVKFIIGPNWSNTGEALIEPIKQKKVVVISPSLGIPKFNEASEYMFNTWQHDEILSQDLAQYVYDKGHRNVALFSAQQNWVKDQTVAFTTKFTSLGGKVASVYEPVITETNVLTEITKVKNNKAIDAVVMTIDGYSLTNVIAKRLRDLSVNLPIYSITIDRTIIKNCDGACDGMIFLTSLTPTSDFEQKYRSAYGREVEFGADTGYDAVMLLAEAFKETNSTDPDQVQVYLNNIKTYTGASGDLISDGKGAFTKPYKIKKVVNGEPVDIIN